MKNFVIVGVAGVFLVLIAAVGAAFLLGEKSPMYAEGTVALTEDLTESAKGMRVLYITVFDAESRMPMPYGAMKQRLSDDVTGEFLEFRITPEKLQVMNPNRPQPRRLRIKARLDVDGLGGMDQPGDLIGQVENVKYGASNVYIEISKKI